MAAHLSLDPKLIEQAVKVSGERTKKAAVTRALEEFIARDYIDAAEWNGRRQRVSIGTQSVSIDQGHRRWMRGQHTGTWSNWTCNRCHAATAGAPTVARFAATSPSAYGLTNNSQP